MQTLLRRVLRTLRRLPVVLHVRICRVRPPPVLPHHRGDQRVPVGLLALVHLHSAVEGVLDVVVLAAVKRETVRGEALLRGAFPVIVDVEHGIT